jgi:hypothetical protein
MTLPEVSLRDVLEQFLDDESDSELLTLTYIILNYTVTGNITCISQQYRPNVTQVSSSAFCSERKNRSQRL